MFGHYLAITLRQLRRHTFSTAVNIACLALGLTCFVSAYIFADYTQSTDRQFANSGRTYMIKQGLILPGLNRSTPPTILTSRPFARYLKADFPELEAVARYYRPQPVALRSGAAKSFRQVAYADPDLLKIFDLTFLAGDPKTALATPDSAILTETSAKAMFGTTQVLGRRLFVANAVDATVTGVIKDIPAPSTLSYSVSSGPFEVLLTESALEAIQRDRQQRSPKARSDGQFDAWIDIGPNSPYTYVLFPVDGRLTLKSFNESLSGFAARHIPKDQASATFEAVPLSKSTLVLLDALMSAGSVSLSLTSVLYGFGGLVFLVACLNFMNLATARAAGRAREVGMRKVMGASRPQVMVQNLLEAAIVGSVALVLSLGGIAAALAVINASAPMNFTLPWNTSIAFWVFLVGLVFAVTALAGAYPAMVLARVRPTQALRLGKIKAGPRFLRVTLNGAQFVAASFLLIAVIVMNQQNSAMRQAGLALKNDPYVAILNSVNDAKIDPKTLRSALLESPAITGVTQSQTVPFAIAGGFFAISKTPDSAEGQSMIQYRTVGENYFSTLGRKLLAGRDFSPDRAEDSWPSLTELASRKLPTSMVLDVNAVQQLGWSDPKDAVGQTVYGHIPPTPEIPRKLTVPVTIIGIVDHEPNEIVIFGTNSFGYLQNAAAATLPIIRIDKDHVAAALDHIDRVWSRLSPNMPIQREFVDKLFDQQYELFEFFGRIFVGLSFCAFVIAAMGLLGMAVHIAMLRRHEIGIRKTLGASTLGILRMLLWDFSKPVVVANVIAWPMAFFAAQLYLSLFATRATLSPLPFALSLLMTLAVAWLAVGGQTIRAARLKPATVLRYE